MWWTIGAFLVGLAIGAFVTLVFFAEQLGPWIKWKEQVMQKEMAISEELMQREKAGNGYKSEL